MDETGENIRVFLRCRPPIDKVSPEPVLKIEGCKMTMEAKLGEKCCSKSFFYDKIFNENTKQEEIYTTAIKPLVQDVFKGFHCTVFAYGQSGTGKTYTIKGERSNKSIPWWQDPLAGAIPRVLFHMFQELSLSYSDYSVRISAVEIYNEEIFDLLNENDSAKLKIFESTSKRSVLIQGLTETPVHTVEEAYNVIEKATLKRQATSTLTCGSGCSHSIFTICVTTKTNVKVELFRNGKLTMVDLAGSENFSRLGAVNKEARDAGSINQSLLTLNRVTMALVTKGVHIPYRESKLTRMLQESIGGNCKTTLIATISPASNHIEETLNTLEYASLAKNVVNYPKSNEKINKMAPLKEYTKEMARLHWDLVATLEKSGILLPEEEYSVLEDELNLRRKKVRENTAKMEEIQEQVEQVKSQLASAQNELREKELVTVQYQNDIEETSKQVKSIKKKLSITKKNVAKEKLELKEAKYLASYQKKKEKEMTHQVKQLLELLQNVSHDAELLNSKIERKNNAEEFNNSALEKINSYCLEKISCFKKCINEMCQKHHLFYRNLEACMDAVASIHQRRSNRISETLNNLFDSYTKYKLYFKNCQEEELHAFEKLQEDQIKIYHEKSVPDHLLKIVGNCNDLSQQILKDLASNHTLICETTALFNSIFEHHIQSLENMANDQGKIFKEIKSYVRNHGERQKRKLEEMNELMSSKKCSFNTFSDMWSKKFEQMQQLKAEFRRITENLHFHNNHELFKKVLNLKENIEKNKLPLMSEAEKLTESAKDIERKLNDCLHSHRENKENEIGEIEEISKISHVQHEILPMKIRYITDNVEMSLKKCTQDIRNAVDNRRHEVTSIREKPKTSLNEINTLTDEVKNHYSKIIGNSMTQQRTCFAESNRVLQDIIQTCHALAEVENDIKLTEEDVQYYSMNYHVYVPTGDTPVRKTYNYIQHINICQEDI